MKNNRTLPRLLAILACLFMSVMVGCGGEKDALTMDPDSGDLVITATVPHEGQYAVPLSSKATIMFNQPLDTTSVAGKISLLLDDGQEAAFDMEVYGRSIIITPENHWLERTNYTINIEAGIKSYYGRELKEERQVSFYTAVRYPKYSETLEVVRVEPSEEDPCWDFMTFRIFFNEPVARTSLKYGESVLFFDKDTNELIPGNVFARAGQMVFDPDEDLTPGKTYRLQITTKLLDYSGKSMEHPYTQDFVAQSTGNRTLLAMDHCPTALEGDWFCEPIEDDETFPKSTMIDRSINSVFTKSVFLGESNMLIGGRLWQEFAETKVAPHNTPFVVRKGQKIYGKPLEYKVGGQIPSGIHTGEIAITLLADAIGYMSGSEFVHGEKGMPATIRLMLDTAMGFENVSANSLMPQPILGAELVGQARVAVLDEETGYESMQIELVGFGEINLGNEFIPVSMSLQMAPPPTLSEQTFDTTPPVVKSVAPYDLEVDGMDLADPIETRMLQEKIIVYFSEPIDPDMVEDYVYLQGPNGKVSGRYDLFNPKLFFLADEPLEPDTVYEVVVEAGIEDISGNKLEKTGRYPFTTMPYQSSATKPPMVAATIPANVANSTMAMNFVPEFYFTQMIDNDSLVFGESWGLYDMTAGGELVPGTRVDYPLFFDFFPDNELVEGHTYLWTINEKVTNYDGVPLDTDMDRVPGGPAIEIYFTATAYSIFSETVFTTYPYADTDVDGYLDAGEVTTKTNFMLMDSPLITDPAFVMGYFPVNVHDLSYDEDGDPTLEVHIAPGTWQFGTNLTVNLFNKETKEPSLLEMGRMNIQIQSGSSTDIIRGSDGYMSSYVDTHMNFNVENSLLNSFLVHDMYLQIPSTMRYTKDGRIIASIKGDAMSGMSIPILGVMDIPVAVDLTSCTVPTIRAF